MGVLNPTDNTDEATRTNIIEFMHLLDGNSAKNGNIIKEMMIGGIPNARCSRLFDHFIDINKERIMENIEFRKPYNLSQIIYIISTDIEKNGFKIRSTALANNIFWAKVVFTMVNEIVWKIFLWLGNKRAY